MKENKNINIVDSILHDIKSPLSNITGYTKLLLSNVAGDITPEQRDYLSRIRRNSYRINLYIEDVADVARILHFQQEIPLEEVDVSKLLNESVERNETLLNDFKSSFLLINFQKDVFIKSNLERIKRTIDVLISNLTKDINKRKVLLASRIKDSTVQIIISHLAEGTSNLDSLFERFEKATDSHLMQHAATSTVIVSAIGGKIEMQTSNISERMFILSFPVLRKG
ncbi:MAG: sensor histidine kinase [Myxococcota bacterium]